jgi:hypothetical protein
MTPAIRRVRAAIDLRDRVFASEGKAAYLDADLHELTFALIDAAPEMLRAVEELTKSAARIVDLEKELSAWKTALTTKTVKCETCDGDGFMGVLKCVHPPDEREEYEDVPCGECGGTGRGHVAFLLDEAERYGDTENARLKEQVRRLREALASVVVATDERHPFVALLKETE